MPRFRDLLVIGLFAVLTGCGGTSHYLLLEYAEAEPTPSDFSVCHGYGCELATRVGLSEAQWAQVRAEFDPPAETAEAERLQIASAVGLIERMVGPQSGTEHDIGGRNPIAGRDTQLDCIDETINTSTYILMMRRDNLLRWHRLSSPALRGVIGMHNTAVVAEIDTGDKYAIDSWYQDNGVMADVVPLQAWLDGWRPDS